MLNKRISILMVAATLAAGSLGTAATAGHAHYSKADKLEKFAQIHGFEHPSIANSAQQASKPRLGVAIAAISQPDLDAMSLEYGVRIDRVIPGSIAANAGLKSGDVVTAIGDRPAYSPERMQHLVGIAGDETTVALTRAGQALSLPIDFAPAKAGGKPVLGIRIQDMTADLKDAFGAAGNDGVLISQVTDGSAADRAGLKAGDVVIAIDNRAIQRTSDVPRALAGHAPGEEVEVKILRERAEQAVTVALGEAATAMMHDSGKGKHGHGHWHGFKDHGHYGYGHPHHGWGKGQGSRHGQYAPYQGNKAPQQRPS